MQVQDAKEGDGVKQVVLQSGANVGLCLLKPEDLKINILASATTSEKNTVTEKFLTVWVSKWLPRVVIVGMETPFRTVSVIMHWKGKSYGL